MSMGTKPARFVEMDSTVRVQSPSSSYSEVVIFQKRRVEKVLQDKRSGSAMYSLGSYPDRRFRGGSSTVSLKFENLRPNYVFRRLGNKLRDLHLSKLITRRILAESQRPHLPQDQPLFIIISLRLTRKEYLETEETCSICLDDFETNPMCLFPGCFHQFHDHCLREWIERGNHDSCPMYRHPLK